MGIVRVQLTSRNYFEERSRQCVIRGIWNYRIIKMLAIPFDSLDSGWKKIIWFSFKPGSYQSECHPINSRRCPLLKQETSLFFKFFFKSCKIWVIRTKHSVSHLPFNIFGTISKASWRSKHFPSGFFLLFTKISAVLWADDRKHRVHSHQGKQGLVFIHLNIMNITYLSEDWNTFIHLKIPGKLIFVAGNSSKD